MKHLFFSIILLVLLKGWAQATGIVPGATYKITTYATGNKTLSVKNSSLDNLANVVTGKVLYMNGSASSGARVKQYSPNSGKPFM